MGGKWSNVVLLYSGNEIHLRKDSLIKAFHTNNGLFVSLFDVKLDSIYLSMEYLCRRKT